MATQRPTTAQSAISSAISDDGERSRPPSGVSYPSQSATAAPPSRRGPFPPNSYAASTTTSSRPQSSASRVSRSHIPSLTAHGFFRPMSSQQAQRQRGLRPATGITIPPPAVDETMSDTMSESQFSVAPPVRGQYVHQEEPEALPPPSRGTEYTDAVPQDRTATASPIGNTTVQSQGDSVRLLKEREAHRPQNLTVGSNYRDGVPQEQPQRSPKGSFRSGFSLGTKRHSLGHHQLSSNASSPRFDLTKSGPKKQSRVDLGRNHEYYEGNTVFFWGGRLQNARDRPINIATGIFVILPAVLFFVFSYVYFSLKPHSQN